MTSPVFITLLNDRIQAGEGNISFLANTVAHGDGDIVLIDLDPNFPFKEV